MYFFFLPLLLIAIVYMDSGGVCGIPSYLFSKGKKSSDVHKGEKSNKFLNMCCQQFQRGRLLSMIQQCCHCCQHDGIKVCKVHMVA